VSYNIYRATTSGGPYSKIYSTQVGATSYVDGVVQSAQTYYYVVTAVDSSRNESVFSNQAQGVIPSP
jgi:fibronectin type 3 domain-containing protein